MKKRSFVYELVKSQIITLSISLLIFLIIINVVFDKGYRKYIFEPIFNTIVESVISYQENWSQMLTGFQETYRHNMALILKDIAVWYENTPNVIEEQLSQQINAHYLNQDKTIDNINWYIISKDGIIVKSNYENDLGLDLKNTVPKYWDALKEMKLNTIRIDKMLYEVQTGIPRIFGYYRLDNGDFFEIGLKLRDDILKNFINQFKSYADNTEYVDNMAVYTVSYEPFGDFPELSKEDIRIFKKAENQNLYTYKEQSNNVYQVYTSLYSEAFNPEDISPIVRTKFEIGFSQLMKVKNTFLTLFNIIISSILIIMFLINYQQVKKLANNLTMIIKKVHDYEKNPATGLSGLEKHSDFKETEKLGNAFKILSHRITVLINKQNSANKNLQTAKDRLEVLASHDELTGVENRRTFFRKIKKLVDQDIYPWALVFVDMDNLKKINDLYGHNTGDKALNILGETLLSCTRTEDLIARIGGDEFVIALIKIQVEQAEKIMERINSILLEKGKSLHTQLELSISYGIYSINEKDAEDLEKIIHIADSRMYNYKAKKKEKKK